MTEGQNGRSRRDVIAASTLGLGLSVLAGAPRAKAAAMTATEAANVKLVNDFCAAWAGHELAKVMSFFSDNPSYRTTELQAPTVGRQAVNDKIGAFLNGVVGFEVHDSWARGPMVINERTDRFSGGRLKSWHGVGVFLVKDGKIVEWQDFTIERVVG